MFRTRDFILVFTSIAFLVMAIGATIWKQSMSSVSVEKQIQFVDVVDQEYSAEVYVPEQETREERLFAMKKKIAESGSFSISAPVVVTTESDEPAVTEAEEIASVLQKCPTYSEYQSQWSAGGIMIEEVEGARIVYREEAVSLETERNLGSTTSAPSVSPPVQRNILLQLPVRNIPSAHSTCLGSDVVGIALDGSLIRNNEASLYGVFGSNTLVGYALDGLPIYGVATNPTDKCGGQLVGGLYGYYLSKDRDVVLNCFSGSPVNF